MSVLALHARRPSSGDSIGWAPAAPWAPAIHGARLPSGLGRAHKLQRTHGFDRSPAPPATLRSLATGPWSPSEPPTFRGLSRLCMCCKDPTGWVGLGPSRSSALPVGQRNGCRSKLRPKTNTRGRGCAPGSDLGAGADSGVATNRCLAESGHTGWDPPASIAPNRPNMGFGPTASPTGSRL